MAASPVDICSNALLMLGQTTIASFDDNTGMAKLASNLWPTTRDLVIRSHPWNCLTKRVTLPPLADAPAFEWAYQFQLPSDWLRTLSIGEDGDSSRFAMENGKILYDEATLNLRYIYSTDAVTSYDSLLIATLVAAMASVMAYPITKSTPVMEEMKAQFKELMQAARSTNGQEDSGDTLGDSPLVNARYYGSAPLGR